MKNNEKNNTATNCLMTEIQKNNCSDFVCEGDVVDSVNLKECYPIEEQMSPHVEIINCENEKIDFLDNESADDGYKIIAEYSINHYDNVELLYTAERLQKEFREVENNWEQVLPSSSTLPEFGKKRKRILLINDEESDPEEEKNREEILKSISPHPLDIIDSVTDEKPKPKSKKVSTQILKEIQARELLQSAIIIPAGNAKKKKKRVLDSDDDEEAARIVDIADIGLDAGNNEDLCLSSGMILIEEVSDFSNSIQNIHEIENNIPNEFNSDYGANEFDGEINTNEDKGIVTISEMENASLKLQRKKKENTNHARDSGNSTDSTNNNRKPPEPMKDPFVDFSSSSSEEFLPNDVYFGTPDKIFVSQSRARGRPKTKPPSSEECGDEDRIRSSSKLSKSSGSSNKNNRPPVKKNRNRYRPKSKRSNSPFSSSSSSSSEMSAGTVSEDSNSDSDNNWKKAVQPIKRKPVVQQGYHKKTVTVNKIVPNAITYRTSDLNRKKRKKDRFYDRSREIPNDIYFGDIQVPLHVLHAYGSSSESDEKNDDCRPTIIPVVNVKNKVRTESSTGSNQSLVQKSNNGKRNTNTTISPSGDNILTTMKNYLKAAGIQRVKFNRLWEGCKSNKERANKILDLLREKGLEGDPTIEKCRKLKKQILTKREIEDLDINAIIETEGRTTRRSSKRAVIRRCYIEDDVEQTLTKLKKVVDSDSDYEHLNAKLG